MSPTRTTREQQKIADHKRLLRFYLRRQRQRHLPSAKTAEGFTRALVAEVAGTGSPITIAAFLPLSSEPPIEKALRSLTSSGHRVLVPVVLPQRELGWVRWKPGTPTSPNALGIEEPVGARLPATAFLTADLRLVPALAYSTAGRRLGQGGGYYDRLFEHLGNAALDRSTLGVVFNREILDGLPADRWDAKLAYLLTETGVRQLGAGGAGQPVE